jgi:hypothetical protein
MFISRVGALPKFDALRHCFESALLPLPTRPKMKSNKHEGEAGGA